MKKEKFATQEQLINAKNARIKIYGNKEISIPFVEVKKGTCTKNISPTSKELEKALLFAQKLKKIEAKFEKTQKEYEEFREKCDHKICVDIPGYPYDIRTCFACGECLGGV